MVWLPYKKWYPRPRGASTENSVAGWKKKKTVSEALLDRVHLGSQDHARLKKYNNNHWNNTDVGW